MRRKRWGTIGVFFLHFKSINIQNKTEYVLYKPLRYIGVCHYRPDNTLNTSLKISSDEQQKPNHKNVHQFDSCQWAMDPDANL